MEGARALLGHGEELVQLGSAFDDSAIRRGCRGVGEEEREGEEQCGDARRREIIHQKCIFLVTFSCLFFIKHCYLIISLFNNMQAFIIKKKRKEKSPKETYKLKEKPKSPSSPS